jgi:hypothetical protein
MSAKNKSKKSAEKSRWNYVHERWELKSNNIWIAHPDRSKKDKWGTVREFVECWKHEAEKPRNKSSISNLAKKWRCNIAEIKKQRTTINNAIEEHYPDEPSAKLPDIQDYTAQQKTTKRSQSNELTKENLAELLGIKHYDRE